MTLSLFQGEGPLSLFRIDDAQRIDATHNVSNKQLSSYYLRYCYMAIPRVTPVSVGLRRALVLRESRERRAGDERAERCLRLGGGPRRRSRSVVLPVRLLSQMPPLKEWGSLHHTYDYWRTVQCDWHYDVM